jgi:hypothetical protein
LQVMPKTGQTLNRDRALPQREGTEFYLLFQQGRAGRSRIAPDGTCRISSCDQPTSTAITDHLRCGVDFVMPRDKRWSRHVLLHRLRPVQNCRRQVDAVENGRGMSFAPDDPRVA